MRKNLWTSLLALLLVLTMLFGATATAASYDINGDDQVNVWDLMLADDSEKAEALSAILGGKDELHKNGDGHWEIWTELGLRNMAYRAQSGDTFELMQDIDLDGDWWEPIEDFNGHLIGNQKTISDMRITTDHNSNMGFFGSIAKGGTVEYLNLKDMNVIASDDAENIGLLAGECAGTVLASTTVGFVTDNRTELTTTVNVGGLVGCLKATGNVETDVENMLFGNPTDEIPNISSQLGTLFAEVASDTHTRKVGIVADAGSGTVDAMALLQDLTGIMPDPNCLAWVTNGDVTTYPHTLEEVLAQVNADGNTVITLQADMTNDSAINIPYTCTLDLNGYSVRSNPTKGNCLNFNAEGSDNKITTVKNGSVYHYEMGIRVEYGAVVVSNVKLYGVNAPCVGIYDTSSAYNDIHLIEGCELYNATWGVFTYNRASSDFTDVNITIRSSKLVSYKSAGSQLFVHRSGSTPGNVTLDYDVEMYTYHDSLSAGAGIDGVTPFRLEGTATIDIKGVQYSGLNHWTTNQSVVDTEVIAEVTNDGETVKVTNTKDMANAVAADGNTQIKLLKSITRSSQVSLPYSCHVDLNGFSITNTAGNSLRFMAAGSENTVATVKNGTINHKVLGIRVDTGSVDISGVTFNGTSDCGASVAFYDPNPIYRSANKIDSCYFYNPNTACVTFNEADTDFSNTGVTITNSTLISGNYYVFGKASGVTAGIITLGEHVDMYGKNATLASSGYRYSGMMAGLTENATVTVGDSALTLNKWSTDKQTETVNVLLIGNSLSTAIPEELYKIAKNAGIALTVTDLYHAGCRSWQHLDWYQNESEEYEYRVYNDMGFWFQGDIKTSNAAFAYLEWDHISFQDFFTVYYASSTEFALNHHESPTNQYVAMLKETFPNAKLYYYEHWAWQVGHSDVPDVETQESFFTVIKEVSRYLCDKNGMTLIPCGEAWELARDDALIGDTMCKSDCLHDNGPTGGQYLNGCVFFETMFQKTCIGDTWRAANGNSPSEAVHQALQQHAHNAVAAVHGTDYAK